MSTGPSRGVAPPVLPPPRPRSCGLLFFFSSSPPLLLPSSLLVKVGGSDWSNQSGRGLLFAYRSGFFLSLFSNRIGLLPEKEAFS